MQPLQRWWNSRYFASKSLDNRYALAEAALIGVISAIAALTLTKGIGTLGGYRLFLSGIFGPHLTLPLFGFICGWLAGWLIEEISPAAGGGGVPQVKAVLAQFPLHLSWKVGLIKALSTILILGGGLSLGRRGPTVHIGAALAAQLSQWVPTSPEHRRQMIAAGAAAGLAAGFNTPIAGVLFVAEELMRDLSGLTLETAIVASFTGSVVSRLFSAGNLNLPKELLAASIHVDFHLIEMPWYLLLGGLAGLLGGLFNRGIMAMLSLNRYFKLALCWRIGLAGLFSGTVISFLPVFFQNNAGIRDFVILGDAPWPIVVLAFCAYFCLSVVAYGSGAPGGLFAPTLVLGAALGYLLGTGAEVFLDVASRYTYALVGMGAFFTAVARVPVTAIVIVFELTTNFNLVLPLMLTSMTAFIVGETVYKGSIYQHLLEANGINLTEPEQSNNLTGIIAEEVMYKSVETLEPEMPIDEFLKAISSSGHRGFPVVETGRLVGIVAQSDIPQKFGRSLDLKIRDIMTRRPVTVAPTAPLSDVLYLLNRYQLSRLPVVEGHQLVGIITRTDIIRAEVEQLSGAISGVKNLANSVYSVYQTVMPGVSRGTILMTVANQETAMSVFMVAAAIAYHRQYEIHCLHVIRVPKHCAVRETEVTTNDYRQLMFHFEQLGQRWNIPIHTEIVVAHDVSEAILAAIAKKPQQLIMGWKGEKNHSGYIFGSVVDRLLETAACDILLVKPSLSHPLNLMPDQDQLNVLIPIAGGPNAQRALDFLPDLLQLSPAIPRIVPDSKICLCQIYKENILASKLLRNLTKKLQATLKKSIITLPLRSHLVSESIIHIVEQNDYDLVILGASRESLLQQTLHGNIPEAIAKGVNRTVIIVRGAIEPN